MRAFAGLALVSGTVSVVGLGSSCGAGDSGAVPVTVAISVSPVISMVNARVVGGECAHPGGDVVVASSSRSLSRPGPTPRGEKEWKWRVQAVWLVLLLDASCADSVGSLHHHLHVRALCEVRLLAKVKWELDGGDAGAPAS